MSSTFINFNSFKFYLLNLHHKVSIISANLFQRYLTTFHVFFDASSSCIWRGTYLGSLNNGMVSHHCACGNGFHN